MNKIIVSIMVVALLSSCGGTRKEAQSAESNEIKATKIDESLPILNEVKHYFATFNPNEITTMILDQVEFEEKFNVARTMDNAPTVVDFNIMKVAAIIAPETASDAGISLIDAKIENRKLIINYSYFSQDIKRSFTIRPTKIFEYNTALEIDSISFISDSGLINTYAK